MFAAFVGGKEGGREGVCVCVCSVSHLVLMAGNCSLLMLLDELQNRHSLGMVQLPGKHPLAFGQ